MADRMTWEQLLSIKRQGRPDVDYPTVGRSNFQRDFDRIVYSSAFRRLQDKAQVFPLAKSDFVRTRLTHSIEVSCVGRSLGTEVGLRLQEKGSLPNSITPSDVGNIVSAACLAHDIGNPPFGHSGEAAIRQWFTETSAGQKAISDLPMAAKRDFEKFEGNAQGFRALTYLQNSHNPGLQLTCATLATFTKYPRESFLGNGDGTLTSASLRKHGYFQAEKDVFDEVAREVGLMKKSSVYSVWSRHPLAYLVEAADDICFHVNDFEDGFRLKHVDYEEVSGLFKQILTETKDIKKLERIVTDEDKVGYLRAKVINQLISQSVTCFMDNEGIILRGEFQDPLAARIESANVLKEILKISRSKIYSAREVLEIEVPGFVVLGGLLDAFLSAVNDVAERGENKASAKSRTMLKLMPSQFLGQGGLPNSDRYTRTLQVTDFVSGMTDSFAVALYKQITGISLPRE